MRVAVLGLGEAGAVYAAGFAASGADVVGYDPADVPTPARVERASGVEEAVREADLVISLVTGALAVEVADEVAGRLTDSALYADLNAAAPERMEAVATALGEAAQRFADVAIIGSVKQFGAEASLLVSGPAAEPVAAAFRDLGSDVEVVGERPGTASRRKILRSVFMKGLGALISEAMDAGAAADETEWVRAQIVAELSGGDTTLDRLYAGTRKHALRRTQEVEAAAHLLHSLGVPPLVTTGVVNRHRLLSREAAGDVESLIAGLAEVPTPAIGDARDRLGLVGPRIRPVWSGARLAGRALTVLTRPGDNKGVHEALAVARP